MELTSGSNYQAASKVAVPIEEHFAKHIKCAISQEEADLATAPSASMIEKILDVAFWASLRKEEGVTTKISLAYMHPSQATKPLLFEHRIPLNVKTLVKLSPGVERAGVFVGVWNDKEDLYIWGTTIQLPNYCFVVDVSEPGLMVVKHRRASGLGKFTNVAVLRGDQIKIVNEDSGQQADAPSILTSLLGINTSAVWNDPVNVLIQIAVSMRAHQRGGILLVAPSAHQGWRESIVQPMQYPVNPAFTGVADLIRQDGNKVSEIYWQNALRREVENVTGLTAVDGATVINDEHELLAFGVKIARASWSTPVDDVLFSEPIMGGAPLQIHPSRIGGTRHLSAAQFVHDQKDALALVASQDGYFTVFSWSATAQMVQAHRIDILLI